MTKSYCVKKAESSAVIDADWNKTFWSGIDAAEICSVQGEKPEHIPFAQVKAAYGDKHIYVIFCVEDQYVRAVATETHGMVCRDSCAEFFFAPCQDESLGYFNLEINCCGVMLFHHQTARGENTQQLDVQDCGKIEVASSLSGPIPTEITEPLTWTLEYALPYEILEKFEGFVKPAPGVEWGGNFYKCGDRTSHPHWLTWSPIPGKPDFHQPEFFGQLNFQ